MKSGAAKKRWVEGGVTVSRSALGSLRAEVAERGTQITQPPCTSSYVRWRFCTTQCVKKLSCTYLTAHGSVPPPPCTSPTFAAFWHNLHLKLSCAYLTRTGPRLGSPVPIFSAPLSVVCTCVKNSATRSLLRARFVPACLLHSTVCASCRFYLLLIVFAPFSVNSWVMSINKFFVILSEIYPLPLYSKH